MRLAVLALLGLLLAGPAPAYVTPGPLFHANGSAYLAGFTDNATLCDLNRDGMDDLVLSDVHGFEVALASGGGSFGPYQHFLPEIGRCLVAHGDFDGDGLVDIAGTNESGVYVAYGSGNGTFADVFQMAYRGLNSFPMTGDLNGDGRADLVAARFFADSIVVAFVAGPGRTLVLADSCQIPGTIEGLAIGDVAGSGAADLVLTTYDNEFVSIYSGNGDGTFGPRLDTPTSDYPYGVAIAPFDGNGTHDLVVQQLAGAAFGSNLGGGAFAPFASLPSPDYGWNVLVGDYDRDGKLDVLTGSVLSGRTGIHTWSGDGAGGFGPRKDSGGTWRYRSNLVQGDIDGDGNLDVGGFFNSVYCFVVSPGNGDGTFGGPASPASIPGRIRTGAAGDFDQDGKADVVGWNQATSKLTFAHGRGDGTFDPLVEAAALPRAYSSFAAGRFDPDANLDLVAVQSSPPLLSFLKGNGDGTFAAPVDFTLGAAPTQPFVIDLNADGRLDVVVPCPAANALSILFQGLSGLAAPVSSATPANPLTVRFADLNGDGRLDRALACTGLVAVQLDDGAGGWTTSLSVARSPSPTDVELADMDEDGRADLVFNEEPTLNTAKPTLHLMRGQGNGIFGSDETFSSVWNPDAEFLVTERALGRVRAIDLDEDGHLDLVGLDQFFGQVDVLRGLGDGTFRRPESYLTAWIRGITDYGDFNGDGHLDIVTSGVTGSGTNNFTSVGVMLNRTGGVVGVPPGAAARVAAIALSAPYPNPARSSFVLRYRVPERSAVSVDLVSVTGRRVLSRTASPEAAGEQSLHIDGLDHLAPGVYGVVVSQGDRRATTRLVVLP